MNHIQPRHCLARKYRHLLHGSPPEEKGPEARLRVHAVKALRVNDASIMPLKLNAHTQTTVYAVAQERASMNYMIMEDHDTA